MIRRSRPRRPAVLAAVVTVTAAFGKSARLASAYGMAVTMTMCIDGLLTTFVALRWYSPDDRPNRFVRLARSKHKCAPRTCVHIRACAPYSARENNRNPLDTVL